jgi:acyl carrier protein
MATLTQDEIFDKIRDVLVDALGVDDDEVSRDASLAGDLGAESIDFLDISFKLEQAFGIKIGQGELFADGASQNAGFIKDGKVTPEGLAAMKARLPHVDLSRLERDPSIANVKAVFTVDTLVKFVESKLAAKS